MTALQEIAAAYADRTAAARAWKAAGGKVVAYLCDTTPEELIEAAGFMAYRITGDPDEAPDSLKQYLFPFWKKHSLSSRQVKQGMNNSMLDLIFKGRFDFVDYLVIAYSRKNYLAFWSQLTDAKKHYPDLKIPELYILDRAITPFFDSALFNRDRVFDFRAKLEEWSGKPISEAAMSAAIAARNENKQLMRNALALPKAEPPRLSGVEALQVIAAGQFLPIATANALTAAALEEASARDGRPGQRVFVGGSPQDNTQLYETIEAQGATVVGEDHNWGSRYAEHLVDESLGAIEGIAERYHKKPAGVQYPLSAAVDACKRRAEACGAQAAVFSVYAHDDHQLWDIPDERNALADAGIPSIYLQEQPYRLDKAAVAGAVARFLKTV
jgi:benzoyl-CoA reductase/2-hydroxyglutaryl-CoA dehydratase subunit BcrC/BadD/HgdB